MRPPPLHSNRVLALKKLLVIALSAINQKVDKISSNAESV